MIRYEIQRLLPVRAKRGEWRGPHGQLRKSIIGFASDLTKAKAEVAATIAAGEQMAPGYATIEVVRYYDDEAFRAWVRDGGQAPSPVLTVKGDGQ